MLQTDNDERIWGLIYLPALRYWEIVLNENRPPDQYYPTIHKDLTYEEAGALKKLLNLGE